MDPQTPLLRIATSTGAGGSERSRCRRALLGRSVAVLLSDGRYPGRSPELAHRRPTRSSLGVRPSRLELAAHDLYQLAIDAGIDDPDGNIGVMARTATGPTPRRSCRQRPGLSADTRRTRTVYSMPWLERVRHHRPLDQFAAAAQELENTLAVATHTELLVAGTTSGARPSRLTASILVRRGPPGHGARRRQSGDDASTPSSPPPPNACVHLCRRPDRRPGHRAVTQNPMNRPHQPPPGAPPRWGHAGPRCLRGRLWRRPYRRPTSPGKRRRRRAARHPKKTRRLRGHRRHRLAAYRLQSLELTAVHLLRPRLIESWHPSAAETSGAGREDASTRTRRPTRPTASAN